MIRALLLVALVAAVSAQNATGAATAAAQNAANTTRTGAAAVTETKYTLKSVSGSGCENNDAVLGKPYALCAPSMVANVTDINGPADECTFPGEINMESGEATCVKDDGSPIGLLGNGKVQPAADGVRSLNGTWLFAKPELFSGTINSDGSLLILTDLKDGTRCELTYTPGTPKKPVKLPAEDVELYVTQAKFDAETAQDTNAAIANGTVAAPPEAPKPKSSAAATGVSGFVLLLGAAAALL